MKLSRIFKLDEGLEIVCESKSTRNGFKHVAIIYNSGGFPIVETKICYLNRTWESFEFQSVAFKAIDLLDMPLQFLQKQKESLRV